jgi:hypothetical protein
MDAMDELPVACTLSPAEFESARGDLLPSLATMVLEWQERPNGLALRFDAAPGRVAAISRTIDRERQCCRFLRFQLTAEPDGGPLWLEVTGPPGTLEFLREVLGR